MNQSIYSILKVLNISIKTSSGRRGNGEACYFTELFREGYSLDIYDGHLTRSACAFSSITDLDARENLFRDLIGKWLVLWDRDTREEVRFFIDPKTDTRVYEEIRRENRQNNLKHELEELKDRTDAIIREFTN